MSRVPSLAVLLVAPLLVAAALLGGCGIAAEEAAHEIQPPRGPYRSVGASASPLPSNAIEPRTSVQAICLVKDNQIVVVHRLLPDHASLDRLLAELIVGPTALERELGIATSVPGASIAGGVQLTDGTAAVQLSPETEGAGRSDQVLAFGQVVCTLDAQPDVSAVIFVDGKQVVSVPRGNGELTTQPLTTADYADLIAPA